MGLLDYIFGSYDSKSSNNSNNGNLSEEQEKIVKNAVDTEGSSLLNESREIRNNKDLIMQILKKERKVSIEYIGEDLKSDKDIIIASLKCNPKNLQYASYDLRNSESVVLEAVRNNDGMFTGYETESILNNYDFMIKIIKDYKWENIKSASYDLKNNKDFCRECAKRYYDSKDYFGDNIKLDTEFMKEIEVYM